MTKTSMVEADLPQSIPSFPVPYTCKHFLPMLSDGSQLEPVEVITYCPVVGSKNCLKGAFRVRREFVVGEQVLACLEIFGHYGPKDVCGHPTIKDFGADWIQSPPADSVEGCQIRSHVDRILANRSGASCVLGLGWSKRIVAES